MIPAIRAEFRKLMTVRSTYVIIATCLAAVVFFAFYIEGLKAGIEGGYSGKMASEVTSAAQALGLIIALAGVLLVSHEYRYNTIMYTLTAARNRTTVLLAKIIAVTVFSVLLGIIVCTAAPFLAQLGLKIKGIPMQPQVFPFFDLLWHSLLHIWGFAMYAVIIAMIVRSQVGSFVALLLIPAIGESLLTLLIKDNSKYLPFQTLNSVFGNTPNYSHAPWVLLGYVVGGLVVAWVLFAKRDAN